ncbi:MAG: hypothetical protein QM755_15260 [Luteolibacter sp.]
MKHLPALFSTLLSGVLAYALVTGALHLFVHHPNAPVASVSPPAERVVVRQALQPSEEKIESPGTADEMIERAARSPLDRLQLAKSLTRLSTSELQDAIQAASTGHPYDGEEVRALLAQEWAERDPQAALAWATERQDRDLQKEITLTWVNRSPDDFGREILQKNPIGGPENPRQSMLSYSIRAIGRQDPLLLAHLMTYNQGMEKNLSSSPGLESANITLSTLEEIKRVAQGLPRQMKFPASGETALPEMYTSNQILQETARRYQSADPDGYKAWLGTLPKSGRQMAENAAR